MRTNFGKFAGRFLAASLAVTITAVSVDSYASRAVSDSEAATIKGGMVIACNRNTIDAGLPPQCSPANGCPKNAIQDAGAGGTSFVNAQAPCGCNGVYAGPGCNGVVAQ